MVRNSSNEELLQFSLKEKRRELKFPWLTVIIL
jgi:hypothetical protein